MKKAGSSVDNRAIEPEISVDDTKISTGNDAEEARAPAGNDAKAANASVGIVAEGTSLSDDNEVEEAKPPVDNRAIEPEISVDDTEVFIDNDTEETRAPAGNDAKAANASVGIVAEGTSLSDDNEAEEANAPVENDNCCMENQNLKEINLNILMSTVIREYNNWRGSFSAFVKKHLPEMGIHYGKEFVRLLLHLADIRKLLLRPPPKHSTRGSTFRPPPGVQWTSDGKTFTISIDGQLFDITWQPTQDVGTNAIVGSVVRHNEDAEGVLASFHDGIDTTGSPPSFFLLDNKAPNKCNKLKDNVPEQTTLMYATLGRPENKATIEGLFGLFERDLGPVVAMIDTSSTEQLLLTIGEAVTRAYGLGRNGRPSKFNGKTFIDRYQKTPSPEELASAIEYLFAIKKKIDARNASIQAHRDPTIAATLDEAFKRFQFIDDGKVYDSLFKYSVVAIQNAIARYDAKREAGTIPPEKDNLRYFAGFVRNCQHEINLRLVEEKLVMQLKKTNAIVFRYFENKASSYNSLPLLKQLPNIFETLRRKNIMENDVHQLFENRLKTYEKEGGLFRDCHSWSERRNGGLSLDSSLCEFRKQL